MEEAEADLTAANANGCTVAHWSSSGGDEAVCRCVLSFYVQHETSEGVCNTKMGR